MVCINTIELIQHKKDCKRGSTKFYKFINLNGGFDNFVSTRIEDFEFNELTDLRRREQHFKTILGGNLNNNNAFGVDLERQKRNVAKAQKVYFERNRE